ncbi:MAG: hypothetical protein ACYDDE_07010 [bacterium]
MRLTTTYQVLTALNEIKMTGQSKHLAKENFKSTYTGSAQIDKFMSSFGKESGIYSDGTFKDYLQVSIAFAKFAKENFKIKDISLLSAEHAQSFLKSKSKLAKDTIQKYSSALEKFETALSLKYDKQFNFNIKKAISGSQKENLKITERSGYHPYDNLQSLVNNYINNKNISDSHKLAVKITAETGLRLHKAIVNAGIKINNDGVISTISKGGRDKILNLSENLKSDLKASLNDKSVFKLDSKEYKKILSELKIAARETNQSYEALHGFRHSFFIEKSAELQKSGMSLKESWIKVSKDMDHNRFVSNYTRG